MGYYVLVHSFVRLDLVLHVCMLLFIYIGEHKAEEKSCTWSQKTVELSLRKQVYLSHGSSFHGLNPSLRRLLSPEEASSALWRPPLYERRDTHLRFLGSTLRR